VITTKSGADKTRANGGSVYAGIGSYGLRDYRANANVGAGGFSLDASVQKRDADNHRKNFASKSDSESLTAQWSGEWLRVGARYGQDKLDSGLPGALTLAQFETDPSQTSLATDHGSLRQTRWSAFAQAQMGEWEFAADAGRREKKASSRFVSETVGSDIDANNYSLRARNSHDFGGTRNLLVVGYDRLAWDRHATGFGLANTATQHSSAWYVKDDVTLAAGTRIALGWRTERADKDYTFTPQGLHQRENAWELGASHPFGSVTAYARLGRSFRFANADEFSYTSPGVDLRPQSSRDAEIGARWKHAGGFVDARVYRSDLTGEIGFDPVAADPFGSFFGANVNLDPTRRQGLELEATHRIAANIGVRVNAQLREATFRSGAHEGKEVPLAPNRTLGLRADWTPAPQHRLSGGVQWVSSQHPDFANACSMPAYTVADARYAYEWKNAEFSAGVANLFDRKYYSLAFACATGKPTSVYPEPGRAFTAAVRVKF
jgi:iron complex outermembrane receptor protein